MGKMRKVLAMSLSLMVLMAMGVMSPAMAKSEYISAASGKLGTEKTYESAKDKGYSHDDTKAVGSAMQTPVKAKVITQKTINSKSAKKSVFKIKRVFVNGVTESSTTTWLKKTGKLVHSNYSSRSDVKYYVTIPSVRGYAFVQKTQGTKYTNYSYKKMMSVSKATASKITRTERDAYGELATYKNGKVKTKNGLPVIRKSRASISTKKSGKYLYVTYRIPLVHSDVLHKGFPNKQCALRDAKAYSKVHTITLKYKKK